MGNGEIKGLVCMTHGHELREGMWVGGGIHGGEEQRVKNRTTVIA